MLLTILSIQVSYDWGKINFEMEKYNVSVLKSKQEILFTACLHHTQFYLFTMCWWSWALPLFFPPQLTTPTLLSIERQVRFSLPSLTTEPSVSFLLFETSNVTRQRWNYLTLSSVELYVKKVSIEASMFELLDRANPRPSTRNVINASRNKEHVNKVCRMKMWFMARFIRAFSPTFECYSEILLHNNKNAPQTTSKKPTFWDARRG